MSTLVRLDEDDLDRVISIDADGGVSVDTDVLARLISGTAGLVGICVGVAGVDYMEHEDGTPELSTRMGSPRLWGHAER